MRRRGESVGGGGKNVKVCFRCSVILVVVVMGYYIGQPILWEIQGRMGDWHGSMRGARGSTGQGEVNKFGLIETPAAQGTEEGKTLVDDAGGAVVEGGGEVAEKQEDMDTHPEEQAESTEEDTGADKLAAGKEADGEEETPDLKTGTEEEAGGGESKDGDEDPVPVVDNRTPETEEAEEEKVVKKEETVAEEEPEVVEMVEKPAEKEAGAAVEEEAETERPKVRKVEEEEGEDEEVVRKSKAKKEKAEEVDSGGRKIIHEGRPLLEVLKKPVWEKPPPATEYPAKEEFALREELVEHRSKKKVVVVTFANFAFMDFVLTWVRHLTDVGVDNILVGAMDERILEALFWEGVPVFDVDSHMAVNDVGWGTPIFHKMGREKVTIVLAFLALGYEILMCDTDMVWLKNPLLYMAKYPDADILTSSDQVVHTVDDESLEIWERAQSAYNIGILHFRPTPIAIKFTREWNRMITTDDKVWDQNGFNDIMRIKQGPAVEGGNGLFWAFDGTLKAGILPVSVFCSGHTGFVQQLYKRLKLEPYAIHATYQFAGTEGKRHRFREFKLFFDPPAYYQPKSRLLAYKPDLPDNLVNVGSTLETHFALANHQLIQLRDAFAIATILGRTLVLPEFYCHFDRVWFPHPGLLHGVEMKQPFICPADHILEVQNILRDMPEEEFGPNIKIREYSLLQNPRFPKKILQNKLEVDLCKKDDKCGTEAERGVYKLGKKASQAKLLAAFGDDERDLIYFNTMVNVFGKWEKEEDEAKFRRRVKEFCGIWCCVNAQIGHIWYDIYWDEKPGWTAHPPLTPADNHRPF